MAHKESNGERRDFTQAWKFRDVVLVVEGEKLHVHRAVLAMCSPVFEKMFTSEFQEKEKKEISLPGKKANEVKELLQVIYPTVERKPPDEIKRGKLSLTLKSGTWISNGSHYSEMQRLHCQNNERIFFSEKESGYHRRAGICTDVQLKEAKAGKHWTGSKSYPFRVTKAKRLRWNPFRESSGNYGKNDNTATESIDLHSE